MFCGKEFNLCLKSVIRCYLTCAASREQPAHRKGWHSNILNQQLNAGVHRCTALKETQQASASGFRPLEQAEALNTVVLGSDMLVFIGKTP